MASGAWTTTTKEDVAILDLTGETPDAFVARHLRQQLDFALTTAREALKQVYDTLPPDERKLVDAILTRNRTPKATRP